MHENLNDVQPRPFMSAHSHKLALSTSWNFHRHRSGKEMLEEIVALGFEWVELGCGFNLSWMPEIAEFVERDGVCIASLQNFCPLPMGGGSADIDALQFTSHEEDKRKRAIRLTQQTIDYAAKLGACCVVLHCGSARGMHSHYRLRQLAFQGKLYTKEFAKAKIHEIQRRERWSALLEKRVVDCLRELGDYASERGICLGIENREAYEMFPSERELLPLLNELNHPAFGYWHHFGHAEIKQQMTLLDHQEWLEQVGFRAMGCHVCDVRGLDRDPLPPFIGTIPYQKLVPLLSEGCIFVLDLRSCSTSSEILESVERWKNAFYK